MRKFALISFAGLGIFGVVLGWLCSIALLVGWFMNIYKLCQHLPIFDMETLIRVTGIIPLIGGIVGWF